MRSSWLYLATRSERAGAPVLIWPQLVATARSAIVVSSVSPDRCDMTALYDARVAMATVSIVSVNVPIWFTLTRIELATRASMPRESRSTLVTNRSSPTSCTRDPTRSVNADQPSQSSSAMPSSIDTIGYRSHQSAHSAAMSDDDSVRFSDTSSYAPSRYSS